MKVPNIRPTEKEGLKMENTLARFAGVDISEAMILTITPHGLRPTTKLR